MTHTDHIAPLVFVAANATHALSASLQVGRPEALQIAAEQAERAATAHGKIAAYLRAEADRATREEHRQ